MGRAALLAQALLRYFLAQAQHGQDKQHHHDQADNIDDIAHAALLAVGSE
jgi:hypothetical protein